MKRPNITPGEWNVAHEFPGSIIAGTVEDSPRGKSATVICRVQGNLLTTYKPNLQLIAAAPDMATVLEDCLPDWHADDDGTLANGQIAGEISIGDMRAIKSALVKAGYTF
jgi:hypothetical protein